MPSISADGQDPLVEGGPIQQSAEYIQHLQGLTHPSELLKRQGYIIEQLSVSDLDRKRRCERCHRALQKNRQNGPHRTPKHKSHRSVGNNNISSGSTGEGTDSRDEDASDQQQQQQQQQDRSSKEWKSQAFRCKFHSGRVANKKWTCCGNSTFAPPCQTTEDHQPVVYKENELERNWKFYTTPPASSRAQVRPAVAIDCEMGVAESGESELIRVSVIDYFSCAVLLDSLVWPDVKMSHYNTRFSGVTRGDMESARRNRTCIFGRHRARMAVTGFLGPDTIVIGHALNQDLNCLRWIHPNVVDTLLIEQGLKSLESQAEMSSTNETQDPVQTEQTKTAGRPLSLKALTLERLGRNIQIKGRGHDSKEDAIATRDLLHWHVLRSMSLKDGQLEGDKQSEGGEESEGNEESDHGELSDGAGVSL